MKAWILIIFSIHGQTEIGTKFNSYEECYKKATKITSNFKKTLISCKKRSFTP